MSEIYDDENPVKYGVPLRFEKNVKKFLFFAAIFIFCGIIWLFAISPLKAFVFVEVESFPGFAKEDVLKFAGIENGTSYVSLNAAQAQKLLASHPLVESAKVIKKFPDRLSIFLVPRQAVALILADVNGQTRPVYIDRYAVPFKIGFNSGQASPYALPVVSGIPVGSSRLGEKLSPVYTPLFRQLGKILDESPLLWQAVSEIKVVRTNHNKYDLLLFPLGHPVKLKMAGDIDKESLHYALLMLDVYRRQNSFPDEIDVRSRIGVVKTW